MVTWNGSTWTPLAFEPLSSQFGFVLSCDSTSPTCYVDSGPDGLPTFADGWRAAALTAAVLESAATNEWRTVQ